MTNPFIFGSIILVDGKQIKNLGRIKKMTLNNKNYNTISDTEILAVIATNPRMYNRDSAIAHIRYCNALCAEIEAERTRYPFAYHDGEHGE